MKEELIKELEMQFSTNPNLLRLLKILVNKVFETKDLGKPENLED